MNSDERKKYIENLKPEPKAIEFFGNVNTI